MPKNRNENYQNIYVSFTPACDFKCDLVYYSVKLFVCIEELHILNSIVLLEYFLTISLNIFKYIKNIIFEISRKPKIACRCK